MTVNQPPQRNAPDFTTYLAAERTLLAWIRTGLAMMGFGFVVARFGLFLRELAEMRGIEITHRPGVSLWVGTVLVVLGVVVTLASAYKHYLNVQLMVHGKPGRVSPWSLAMAVAILMAMLGLFISAYLVFGLEHRP